ncbi:MAG: HD domain-containing protein [Patescibacteria group bacterium]|nr:HD domain-containing protein [Patescibacteria group bacterium]
MDIINEIKHFVENECKKPSSKYGYEPFPFHFVPMVNYAKKLADELGGDKEIILIAAWLHDIGSIIYGREDHHITSAKVAEEKLKELQYPAEKIELIKKCIFNHRGSQQNGRNSIEEQIIAEVDVLSNFDNIAGIFKAAFVYEDKTQGEAKDSVRQKLERKWKQLHFENSKKIIKPKYEAAILLLK